MGEMRRILSDADTYIPLAHNPTAKFKKELTTIVEAGFNKLLLNKKERSF